MIARNHIHLCISLPEKQGGWGWCRWDAQCRESVCRCHKWLHCPRGQQHRCAPRENGWRGHCCMAQQQRWTPEERGRLWNQALISCHNQRRDAPREGNQVQNQFLHQRHWRPKTLGVQCNCQQAFWCGPSTDQQSLSNLPYKSIYNIFKTMIRKWTRVSSSSLLFPVHFSSLQQQEFM